MLTDARPDVRVRDGAIAWSAAYHDLIATTRRTRLLGRRDARAQTAFEVLARQVEYVAGRISWPMADEAPRWTPSIEVQLPSLNEHIGLLRLHARAMFEANARGEAVAVLGP